MSALLFSTFPWQALGLLVTILVGGLIFSNQDMLGDAQNEPQTKSSEKGDSEENENMPEEKCSDRPCT